MWTQVIYFFVFFFAGDFKAVSEPESKLTTWIGILIAIVICTLLVICLLVLKMCWSKVSGGKQTGKSLWAEEHPLNTKTTED